MRAVHSGRFSLEVRGRIGGLEVRRATGMMTRNGEASGTVDLEQGGQLVEFDVVYMNGSVYVRGPTGPFQAVSPVVAGTIYDPTRLLAPSGGLTELLTSAQQAKTEEREGVDGADAFRVTAVLEGKVLGPLVPNSVPPRVPATLWIGAAHPSLLKAETSLPRGASSEATAITLTISDFNLPVEVTPPSTS